MEVHSLLRSGPYPQVSLWNLGSQNTEMWGLHFLPPQTWASAQEMLLAALSSSPRDVR